MAEDVSCGLRGLVRECIRRYMVAPEAASHAKQTSQAMAQILKTASEIEINRQRLAHRYL